MSEQNNTALVQSMYAAFAKGDVQTILNNLTDDVEWILEGPEIIPFAGKRVGKAQVTAFFEALGTTQADQKLTMTDFVEQGDKVAAFGRYAGMVKATGKRFDSATAHLFVFRNGKVCKYLDYIDTAKGAEVYTASSSAGA